MLHTLEIKEEANNEIIQAFNYYNEKRVGLGEEFLDHLELYFEKILMHPTQFPRKRKPYREAFLKRFPYLIIYETLHDKVIVYSVY